jgi:hypothetical protein
VIEGVARAARRRLVLEAGGNGIDFIEVVGDRTLLVRFLGTLPRNAYELHRQPPRVSIEGGVHLTGLRAVRVEREGDAALLVVLDRRGDSSTYTLAIDAPLDPVLRRADFSFREHEPADCLPAPAPPAVPPAALADYLAKDYASFRQVLLDLASRLDPRWTEQGAADLGVALVELLAYTGDQLSYLQDAIANEGFLDRARLRVSARRHARLLDVRMREGRNAWTWVCFTVQTSGTVMAGTRISTAPASRPGLITPDALAQDPALAGAVIFETAADQPVDPLHNELRVHDWSVPGTSLPAGATSAYLYALDATGRASRPALRAGDWLLLEEVAGPSGGLDPTHRQAVRLIEVRSDDPAGGPLVDPLLALPLQLVQWGLDDALRTPYVLSAQSDLDASLPPAAPFTVARGNVAAADHGLTTGGTLTGPSPTLTSGPLTVACPPPDLACPVDDAAPAIELRVDGTPWTPVPDLLGSGPLDTVFVVEIDDDGIGRIRFGDGVQGARPASGAVLDATWRVGGGAAGNVGAESLQWLDVDGSAPWMPGASVRNPLDARAGQDAESIADLRGRLSLVGPTLVRAVTEADYVAAVQDVDGVAAAAAAVRWTGSWHTALVAVQPADSRDLVVDADGRWRLAPNLSLRVRQRLDQVRMAGRDVEVRPPHRAGLDVRLRLHVLPGFLAAEVRDAVVRAVLATPRVLGAPVFLSQFVTAAQTVDGVVAVTVRRFQRYGQLDQGELAAGVVRLGPFELASFENDPDRPQLGILRVSAGGDGE